MTNLRSADLEMTVNMLIQIDKLVQLIESPVFTCKLLDSNSELTKGLINDRSAHATARTGEIPASL